MSTPGGVVDTRRDPGAFVFLALMVLIGSSTATAAKFAVRELPVGLLPLIRFGIASLCLVPILATGESWRRMFREDFGRLAVCALLCVPINQTFFLNGARLAPTTHVGLIYAACPLVVLLLATALGQERLVAGRLAGILVTVAGAGVIGLGSLLHQGPESTRQLWGDLLLVGAVASWGGYLTVNKPLVARHGSLTVLAGTFLLGSLLDLPIAALTYPGHTSWSVISPAAWWGVAHLAIVVTVLGLACQNQALRRLDASQVATFGNAAPLLTILWGVWLLGETITVSLIIGGSLILGGILWTSHTDRTAAKGVNPVV